MNKEWDSLLQIGEGRQTTFGLRDLTLDLCHGGSELYTNNSTKTSFFGGLVNGSSWVTNVRTIVIQRFQAGHVSSSLSGISGL